MRTTKVRELNTEKIRNCLKRLNNATKLELSEKTGLSVATCGNLLREMLKTEEVYEIAPAESTGGRPSKRFVYNSNYKFVSGIYLRMEGTKRTINVNVSNLIGENIDDISYDFEDITLQDLEFVIELILKKYPKIAVIALGVPGVVKNGYLGYCDFKGHLVIIKNARIRQKKISSIFISRREAAPEAVSLSTAIYFTVIPISPGKSGIFRLFTILKRIRSYKARRRISPNSSHSSSNHMPVSSIPRLLFFPDYF
jgi:hypothetical protein